MKIFIAADHTGFILKATLTEYLREVLMHDVVDLGAATLLPEDDYPDYMIPCAEQVVATPGSLGIILGGSGQGEAMAANRVKGARCAIYYGQAHATGPIDGAGARALDGYDIIRLTREHNDANMLSLAARFLDEEDAKEAVRIFTESGFSGEERHIRRIGKF